MSENEVVALVEVTVTTGGEEVVFGGGGGDAWGRNNRV